MSPEMFRKLAALGLSHDQMAGVLDIFEEDAKTRKSKARARVQKWRDMLPPGWEVARIRVIERDGYICQYCGEAADPPHVDHVLPLSRGGTNDLNNLVVACQPCNSSKRDKTPDEWQQ